YRTAAGLADIPGLVHGFGTAAWGPEEVAAMAARAGFRAVLLKQIHSDAVHVIDADNVGRAAASPLPGDALVTALPGVLLVVKTADCLPVFLVDEARRVVAAVHCGWRGTLRRILERTLAVLGDRFGAPSEGLWAALGPCIGSECYEVGPEVRAAFDDGGFSDTLFRDSPGRPGRALFDLRGANLASLRAAGLAPSRIIADDACTRCDPRLLSFRRDKNKDARMASFLGFLPS
ncbi:MAG: peptidoglycan editing factor PgeF, partial [Candidatus Aminicenantes bacterium]|nr:peptidoglycan editing factor PgeF [Candidatus Aminicenantes bacterium]